MVQLCIALLFLGVVFLLLEMWLPGMEMFALAGIGALIVSAILAVMFVPNGWLIVAGQTVIVAGFLVHMYRYMQRKQLKGKLILSESLDAPKTLDVSAFIGREGRTITALRPRGEADFNGTKVEVASHGPMIAKGTKVRVDEIQTGSIIVSPVEGN